MMVFGALGLAWTLAAQTQETYKARLSPVPVDAQSVSTITGHGSASAVIAGTKLTVSGIFDGMHSAAIAAHLHQGKVTGIRGPVIHELTVSKATAGQLSGSVELTAPEVEALRKGLLYILVTSTGASEGNLWGWLLK
jgi:CHRD domain-containing protein